MVIGEGMSNKKLEEDIKKRSTSPYYSSSYENKTEDLSSWEAEWKEYAEDMAEKLMAAWGKDIPKKCCSNPKKYKNGMGKLVWWACSNCGADLGDVND